MQCIIEDKQTRSGMPIKTVSEYGCLCMYEAEKQKSFNPRQLHKQKYSKILVLTLLVYFHYSESNPWTFISKKIAKTRHAGPRIRTGSEFLRRLSLKEEIVLHCISNFFNGSRSYRWYSYMGFIAGICPRRHMKNPDLPLCAIQYQIDSRYYQCFR